MVQDGEGFHVHGTDVDGDPFDLNTLEDTWYIYPHDCDFAVTKMALATEELYFHHRRSIGRPCRPGLA